MVKFTAEQMAIIRAPLTNMLVSAAAGSGKTAVMTERIVERLAAGQADVRKLLVLTFTNNAAANMKDKIEEKLAAVVAAEKTAGQISDLEAQLYYLPQAAISTVHSFCKRLILNFSDLLTEEDLPAPGDLLPPAAARPGRTAGAVEAVASADQPLLKNRPVLMDDQLYQAELLETFECLAAEQLDRLEVLEEKLAALERRDLSEAVEGAQETDRAEEADRAALETDRAALEAEKEELLAFRDCLNLYFGGRLSAGPDSRATSLVGAAIALYHNMRSLPDYPAYLKKLHAALCAGTDDFALAPAGQHCLTALSRLFERFLTCKAELQALLDDPEAALVKKAWADRRAVLQEIVDRLSDLGEAFLPASPTEQARLIAEQYAAIPAMPPLRTTKNDTVQKARLIYLLRAIVGELLFVLKGDCHAKSFSQYYRYTYLKAPFLPLSSAAGLGTEEARLSHLEPFVRAFFNFVLRADRRFALRRYERGLLHFSDLEQLSLLLVRKPVVKTYCQEQYQELYVDEFQDTNDIQMAILDAISDGNLFVVGDIKQSIYRFRYAKPEIFAGLYNDYQKGRKNGTVFELHRNFRSHGKVLRGVNRVFRELMVGDLTQIQYRDGHAFDVDMSEAEATDAKTRLYLTSWPKDRSALEQAWPDLSPRAVRYIPKLRQLLQSGYSHGDLCVLVKTNQEIKELAEALSFFNIPYTRRDPEFHPDRYEQQVLAALVFLLENPLQDQPLLTVMTSPLLAAPFDEADLFRLKQWSLAYRSLPADLTSGGPAGEISPADGRTELAGADLSRVEGYGFWQHVWSLLTAPEGALQAALEAALQENPEMALQEAGAEGEDWPPLYRKLQAFKAFLERSRRRVKGGHLSEGLRLILGETAFEERLLTLADGRERVERVQNFLSAVAAFELGAQRDIADLAAVLRKENGLPESKRNETESSAQADAVHLMTIHGSKGLEFPVVIMGDFDLVGRSRGEAFRLSEHYGVGAACNYYYQSFSLQLPTVTGTVVQQEEEVALFAESLRLLYVAMTRAEEELHVITADLGEEKDEAFIDYLLDLARASADDKDSLFYRTAGTARMAGTAGTAVAEEAAEDKPVETTAAGFFKDWHLLKAKKAGQLIQAALAAAGGGSWPPRGSHAAEPGESRICETSESWPSSGGESGLVLKRTMEPAGGDWVLERCSLAAGSPAVNDDQPDLREKGQEAVREEVGLADLCSRGDFSARQDLRSRLLEMTATSSCRPAVSEGEEDALDVSHLPLKLTVSEVKRRMQADLAEGLAEDGAFSALEQPVLLGTQQPAASSLWRGVNLDVHALQDLLQPAAEPTLLTAGPELGQLLHRVFQLMDWGRCRDESSALLNLQQMMAAGQLKEWEYRSLAPFLSAFTAFAQSDLNARVQAAEKRSGFTVYRELPFTLALSVQDLPGMKKNGALFDGEGQAARGQGRTPEERTPQEQIPPERTSAVERIMVQGIIDLWFMEDDGPVLVDYKSDYLEGDDQSALATLKERYAGQLEIYAQAITAASGRPVKEGLIWSIRRNKAYQLF